MSSLPRFEDAARLSRAAADLLGPALERARAITASGDAIDEHQVLTERISYAATEARAVQECLEFWRGARAAGRADAIDEATCAVAVALLGERLRARVAPIVDDLGIGEAALEHAFPAELRALSRRTLHESVLRAIGRRAAETRGRNATPLDETLEQVRDSVREFAELEVMPRAERIHREDLLIPDELIEQMAKLGYFGLSVPEQYGGFEMGNLAMILTTEELSRASLAGAGSLITRPEILAKALLGGGTEEQKKFWLPQIASGSKMVAISVTEPDIGSDVAGVKCRAERNGDHWLITGPKAWCTFAGRADLIALLARTDPDASKAARGLSLFIVEKDRFPGHSFEMRQPGGGRIVGKADATPGYRGMHSFTLNFERYRVPTANLVGGEGGIGRGFYLQMAGFAAGRLQTGGRACGLAQAAFEKTAEYVVDRMQFGNPIASYGLTQFHLGEMAAKLCAARALTYAAARAFDADERKAAPLAAQAKLLACDVAVEVAQQGQLLHGGWGYAEEYPISRYVVDAQVLPIFEGVKATLELKVVGRSLLGEA